MPILTSQIISARPQADGREYITERHTDHNGQIYDVEYLAEIGTDSALVMNLRAANIGATIDAREAAAAEAANYSIPIAPVDWMRRFTMQERIAIRSAAKTDPVVEDILELLAAVKTGVVLTDTDTQMAIGYFAQQGLITMTRAMEIGLA
jgi:hypothetical protein